MHTLEHENQNTGGAYIETNISEFIRGEGLASKVVEILKIFP